MQTKIKIQSLLFLFACIVAISISSCKKEKDTDPATSNTASTAKGTLLLHLHSFIDAQEVDAYNIDYTTEAGRMISLSIGQFYMSDIQLEKLDGTFYDVGNQKLLKTLATETYVVGDVPAGNYRSIRFKVGLPSSTNTLDPTSSGDSLILNRSEMWFSGTAQPDGYVFFNAQGSIDTSADLSGKMCPFVYKIGTDANYKQVQMPVQNFTIVPNQSQFVHMYADFSRLFTGVVLDSANLNVSSPAENSSSLATQIVNNIPSVFKYE